MNTRARRAVVAVVLLIAVYVLVMLYLNVAGR